MTDLCLGGAEVAVLPYGRQQRRGRGRIVILARQGGQDGLQRRQSGLP